MSWIVAEISSSFQDVFVQPVSCNAGGEAAIFATISVDAKVRAGGDITIFGKPKQINKKGPAIAGPSCFRKRRSRRRGLFPLRK